ncbi:MAG: PAS domain S-box protein, partial [Zavarzinella sp.]|nr:PAS domain S-box protein [Zavarzinella sp.]
EGTVVTFTDVTALKQVEARARDLADLLKLAPVLVRDLDDRIVFWDRGAEQLYGYSAAEAVGQISHDLLRTTLPRPFEELRAELLRAGHWEGEMVHHRKDGSEITVICRWVLRPPADGQPAAILVAAADITDRKRIEVALRESEERFRDLADSAPVLIWVNGPDGCEFVNKSYLAFTGATMDRVRGPGWSAYVHPDDLEWYLGAYQRALAKRAQFESQCRLRRKDGEYRWFKSIGLPRFMPDGSFLGYVGSSVDITDVREADRQKDAFLAMLAHELRNPLAPVLNAVQVIRLRGPADPVLNQQREVIERQVGQMKRLLDDLLDVARITRGAIQVQKAPFDLRDAIKNAVEAARPHMAAKKHDLRVSLPDEPLVLEGDATRLTQVFSNLLNNAAKYTDPGGRVRLTALKAGTGPGGPVEAVIRVTDTGVGMTPDMVARAFDLFAQADQSLDRSQGGLGIGLTLVRRLVALHGGTVTAASEGPGRGSEFTVRLPLLPTGATAREPAKPPQEPRTAGRRRRVLVVDDNVDSADSLALLLGIWEHEVRTAHDGPAAIQVARSFRPEVVLLDLGMPGMNGYDVARELRKVPDLRDVELVALTGYGQDEDRKQTQEAGFSKHLTKPVDPEELRSMLADLAQ